jgi:quinol monooxygenase YgiN
MGEQKKNPVQYVIEWRIHPGRHDEFRTLVEKVVALVEAAEPLMRSYDWYYSTADRSRAWTVELYSDDAGIAFHVQNTANIISKFLDVADIVGFNVYGDPSKAAQDALAPFKPVYYGARQGFTRP